MKPDKADDVIPVPCAAWAEKLAAQPGDLAAAERAALDSHALICPACAAVQAAYREMDARILTLPPVAPLAELPLALRQLLDEQSGGEQDEVRQVDDRRRIAAMPLDPDARAGGNRATRPYRWLRLAGAIAAVLAVGALIASSVILFNAHQTLVSGQNSGSTLFVASRESDGTVYAVRPSNGAVEWQNRLGHKLTGSLLATKDALFTDSTDDGLVYALRKSDGSLLWTSQIGGLLGPIFTDGASLYLYSANTVFAVSAHDGTVLWHRPISACFNCKATIVAVTGGMIYAYFDGLYALQTSDGRVLWHHPEFPFATDSPVVTNGKVYVPVEQQQIVAVLHANTGQVLRTIPFQKKLSNHQYLPSIEMVAAPGVVYIDSGGSDLYAIRASDDSTLWHKQFSNLALFGLSALDDGALYFASTTVVVDSIVVSGQNITPTPSISTSAASTDVYALNTSDGSQRWHWQPTNNNGGASDVLAMDGNIYLSVGGNLYAMSGKDGKQLWVVLDAIELGTPVAG